jgi:hypothetical protein
MLLVESGLVITSLIVAFVHPTLGSRFFGFVERRINALARKRRLSVIVIGLTAVVLRVALFPVEPIPKPTIHDEYSYLLMSDTFAQGRLANPTHPMWAHFDATYVNQKPTYVSKYFPAPGLFLAFGQVVFGHPFWGVCLGIGLMCASLCWMLQGWFPPFWALLGSMIAIIRLGTFSYWANSYLGCTLPAIGGALVLGAFPRVKRRASPLDSFLMGVGLVLLAGSRPFEGLIFSVPVFVMLLIWIWSQKNNRRDIASRVLLPTALVLVVGLAGLLYYFWRTTGSPLHTPYQVNLQAQDPVPLFPWQSLRPIPQSSNSQTRALFFGWEMEQYNLARTHFIISNITRVVEFYLFFLGPALTLPFLLLAVDQRHWLNRLGRNRTLLLLVFIVSGLGLLLPTYYGPNYAATVTCVVYAFLVVAFQSCRGWYWRGKSIGLAIVRSVPAICLLLLLLRAAAPLPGVPMPNIAPLTWCSPHLFDEFNRSSVETALEPKPGRHLALVRYRTDHPHPVDWVQNLADIDSQRIVWANDLGPQENEELIRYYKDRKVWLVEPDKTTQQLTSYPGF